jgi:hypothetical protein
LKDVYAKAKNHFRVSAIPQASEKMVALPHYCIYAALWSLHRPNQRQRDRSIYLYPLLGSFSGGNPSVEIAATRTQELDAFLPTKVT